MATYNGQAYLREQLASLDAQTRLPDELVISDDGSTDDTRAIIAQFQAAARFPVKIVLQDARLGYRLNFLKAAEQCAGDIVSFCDQDDVWRRDKIEIVGRLMEANPDVLLCFHNSTVTDATGARIRLFYPQAPCAAIVEPLTLSPQFVSYGFSQSLRTELLAMAPASFVTGDWLDKSRFAAHDVFFFVLASSLARIAYIDEPLVDYRQHATNAFGVGTVTPAPSRWQRLAEMFQDLAPAMRRYAATCGSYATAARQFAAISGFASAVAVDRAVDSWQLLARAFALRGDVRGQGRLLSRAVAYHELHRLKCYDEDGFWTFGKRARLADLLVGVLVGPALKRWVEPAFADGSIRKGRGR